MPMRDKECKKGALQTNTSHDIHVKLLNKNFSKLNFKNVLKDHHDQHGRQGGVYLPNATFRNQLI